MDTAGEGPVLAPFWAAATGCEFVPGAGPGDPGDVVGEVEGMGIAICPVPERKTVKHRVHLDLHTDSVETLLALGATRAPGYDDPTTRGRCCSTRREASCAPSCARRCRRTRAPS